MTARLSEAVKAFLREKRFAVLATINPDCSPQLSTVWYELRDGEIMMNTKRGRIKDRNLVRDPRASICIEDDYRYLTIRGPVILVDNQDVAQADIKALSTRYHGPEKAEEQVRGQFSREERITILLRPDKVTAYGFGD